MNYVLVFKNPSNRANVICRGTGVPHYSLYRPPKIGKLISSLYYEYSDSFQEVPSDG